MKKNYIITLCTVLSLTLSCSSDSDNGNSTNNDPLSVEAGKEELEENSLALLNEIEDFKENDDLAEIIELAEFLNVNEDDDNLAKITISNISNLKSSNQDIVTFNAKQAIAIVAETPAADEFEESTGVFVWNSVTEEFDKTEDSNDIIYNIDYNNKTAVFSVTSFNTALAGDDNEQELPTGVIANLAINNKIVFSQEYNATLQSGQLIPAEIKNTTRIADFYFTTTYTNSNNNSITQSFDFKIKDETITAYQYTANGNFNNENVDAVEDLVDNATLSFQFLDANLTLEANDANLDSEKDYTVDEQISLLNTNTNAVLSINNREIATSQFYKDNDTYTTFVYNQATDEFEETEVSEDIVNARFLFSDGTTNDFETYIDGSFTSIEEKFEAVFNAYENLFSDI